ncbi:hypothetical protein ACHAWU_007242 [Discostella pseudostelligera]|jgi:adenosylcobinamide kinase/adenosylcobinamide-phosphate guanylyltransferase|uniref:Adenosylcobinamide kinase n=1 Tax=Discostella pseudostelligera TaxID=259834 RepID=A0ABD3M2I8_9STRA
MATVYLVTGGARSGKSSYAQSLAEKLSNNPIYLATSKAWDDDFQRRIERHQQDRGDNWTTIEEVLYPSKHADMFSGRVVLVDCLTLWLTNYFLEENVFTEPEEANNNSATSSTDRGHITTSSEKAFLSIKAEFDKLISQWDATFIFVTNEIGSGLHSESLASRAFVDAQGWFNQDVAASASMVVHMVSGVPNIIKQLLLEDGVARDPAIKAPISTERMEYAILDRFLSARALTMDEKGYFLVKLDSTKGVICATYHSCIVNDKGEVCDVHGNKISCSGGKGPDPMMTFEGRTAKELTVQIFERWGHAKELVSVGHAAYIGREAQKAEQCLFEGRSYQQD